MVLKNPYEIAYRNLSNNHDSKAKHINKNYWKFQEYLSSEYMKEYEQEYENF